MNRNKIKQMVTTALLMAIIVVLQLLAGYIRIGALPISLVLLPIVLGAAMYGPKTGALLGGAFGAIVYICCVLGIDLGGAMVLSANPLMCFIVVMGKGVLAGFLSGLVYKALKNKNRYIAMLLSAIVCPVVNTGVFIGSMFLFFNGVLNVWAESAGAANAYVYVLSGLVLMNFVPELIINILFSPASARITKMVKN